MHAEIFYQWSANSFSLKGLWVKLSANSNNEPKTLVPQSLAPVSDCAILHGSAYRLQARSESRIRLQ